MSKKVALLRGINVSGKNKIPMKELKIYFEEIGFTNVVTYLNSGNVLFETELESPTRKIEQMIQEKFALDIPVFVCDVEVIQEALLHAPNWWATADKNIYDNLIFFLDGYDIQEIVTKLGEPSADLEQIQIYKNVIFWSFDLKKHAKANWWKNTAAKGIGEALTIRTANTVKKLVEISKK